MVKIGSRRARLIKVAFVTCTVPTQTNAGIFERGRGQRNSEENTKRTNRGLIPVQEKHHYTNLCDRVGEKQGEKKCNLSLSTTIPTTVSRTNLPPCSPLTPNPLPLHPFSIPSPAKLRPCPSRKDPLHRSPRPLPQRPAGGPARPPTHPTYHVPGPPPPPPRQSRRPWPRVPSRWTAARAVRTLPAQDRW